MPRMIFGTSAFQRTRGDLPALPVINMFAEAAPTEETGLVLQSRPGLSSQYEMSDGPVSALFAGDGALAGALFGISGGVLHSGTDVIGAVDGSGPFSMDAYDDRLFVAGGGSIWTFHGVTLSAVTFPDSANVTKILIGGSRLIALRADTEQFYWSDVLSTTIGALSFASAENQPDRLRDALFIDDILVLFGAETVEFWPNTGDADLPFQPLEGRVFELGIKATGCATEYGTSFAWVTNTNQVCVSDPETVISDAGIDALIEASSTVRLQRFHLEGSEFLWLRLDGADWLFSARSKRWSQFETYGESNWRPSCYAVGYFGSGTDGTIYQWGTDHIDGGGVLERRFRAGFPLNSGGVTISNVILRTNPGATPYVTGDYTAPVVEMRRSLDGGKTFGAWRQVSLGESGDWRRKVQWAACGMAGNPGWISEFRVTDPVPFRVSDVLFNEPFGGI